MSGISKIAWAGGLALGFGLIAAAPASAESWARFSASDRTAYLVDLDTLALVDGVATVRLARVPATGEAGDLSHEVEDVMVRCSDGNSKSGTTVTYGPDGAETDRYSDEAPWGLSTGGVYGALKSFACDDMRPAGDAFPTVQAFIEGGRGQ